MLFEKAPTSPATQDIHSSPRVEVVANITGWFSVARGWGVFGYCVVCRSRLNKATARCICVLVPIYGDSPYMYAKYRCGSYIRRLAL